MTSFLPSVRCFTIIRIITKNKSTCSVSHAHVLFPIVVVSLQHFVVGVDSFHEWTRFKPKISTWNGCYFSRRASFTIISIHFQFYFCQYKFLFVPVSTIIILLFSFLTFLFRLSFEYLLTMATNPSLNKQHHVELLNAPIAQSYFCPEDLAHCLSVSNPSYLERLRSVGYILSIISSSVQNGDDAFQQLNQAKDENGVSRVISVLVEKVYSRRRGDLYFLFGSKKSPNYGSQRSLHHFLSTEHRVGSRECTQFTKAIRASKLDWASTDLKWQSVIKHLHQNL